MRLLHLRDNFLKSASCYYFLYLIVQHIKFSDLLVDILLPKLDLLTDLPAFDLRSQTHLR